jgi:hypothetical protein
MVSGTSHRKDLRNVMLTIVGSPLNPAGSTRLLYSISDHKYEQSIGRSNEMQTKRVLLMLSLWLVLATAPSLAQNESSDIVDLLQSGKYKEAEAFYRPLLSVDTTGVDDDLKALIFAAERNTREGISTSHATERIALGRVF